MFSIDFWIEVYESRPPCKCWQEQLPVRLYLSYLGCFSICAQGTLFTPIIQLRTTIPSITSFLLKKNIFNIAILFNWFEKKTNHKTRYWKRNLCALHSNIIKVPFHFWKKGKEKKQNMFKWSPVKMLADKQTDVVYALSSCWFYFLLKRHAAHIYTRTLVFYFYFSLSFSQNLVSTCWFKQLDFPD